MPDQAPLRWRDSPRVILADYLASLPTTLIIVAGLWAFGMRSTGLLAGILTTLAIVWVALAVVEPVFRQATHRYELTSSSLRHEMGLIERRRRDFPWRSIAAVNTDRPWAHRLLGLYRLTLTQAGDESTRVVLRGVTRPTVDLVLSHVEAALPTGQPSAPAADRPRERTIYAASVPELVLMSFVYGQVLVLAAAGGATLWDLLEGAGLLEPFGVAARQFPAWAQFLGAIVVAVLIGVGATLVRFFRFRVGVSDHGTLSIRFGLLESQERRIDPAAVEGIVVHRNLVEQWIGRARLALLTTDSASQLRSNLLLPSLPVDVVRSLAREHFAGLVASESLLDDRPRRARALLLSIGVLGAAAGAGLGLHQWTTLPLWAVLLAGLSFLFAISFLGRSLSTRFSGEDTRRLMNSTTRFAAERQTTLRVRAIGQVATMGWLRPRPHFLCVMLGAYAGRPLRWLALAHPRASVDHLAHQVLSGTGDAPPRPQPWRFAQ